jgi:uncharacterized protein (DUF736 family)
MSKLNEGAGWIKKAKSGLTYISAQLNVNGVDVYLSIFKNTKKLNDKSPDYNIKVNEKITGNKTAQNNQNVVQNTFASNPVNDPWGDQAQNSKNDDDIPF